MKAKYWNNDERFGAQVSFTMAEMIAQYRSCGWDETDEGEMTDAEIEADILAHDVQEISETNERVIFDNGGGITVQLLGWAHYYQDEEQAALDVAEWIKYRDTSVWDGHDDGALACEPTSEQTRNGGYRTWAIHPAPFGDEYDGEFPIDDWGNTSAFFASLAQVIAARGLS